MKLYYEVDKDGDDKLKYEQHNSASAEHPCDDSGLSDSKQENGVNRTSIVDQYIDFIKRKGDEDSFAIIDNLFIQFLSERERA